MAGSSSSDDEGGPSPTAFVASILGVKGALRFRAHGSTQKPHIMLRRVVTPADDTDDGDANRVVRFSLFALKRIDVKPGKEILLCVATENGEFKDTPIVFESDPNSVAEDGKSGGGTHIVEEDKEEEAFCPPVRQTVPPKMRRAWTKKVEDTIPCPAPASTRVSIGVQASPTLASKAVEAVPGARSVSIQAKPLTSSISTQVVHSSTSVSVQVQPDVEFVGTQTRAPSVQVSMSPATPLAVRGRGYTSEDGEEEMDMSDSGPRSLSPMDLDSDASSAASTPVTSFFPASLSTTQSSLPEQSASPLQKGGDHPHSPVLPTRHSPEPSAGLTSHSHLEILEELRGPSWPPDKPLAPPASSNSSTDQQASAGDLAAQRHPLIPTSLALKKVKEEEEESPIPPLSHPKAKKPAIYDMFVPAKMGTGPSGILDTISSVTKSPEPPVPAEPESWKGTGIAGSSTSSQKSKGHDQPPPSVSPPVPKATVAHKYEFPLTSIPTGPRSMVAANSSPPIDPLLVARPVSGSSTNPLNIAPSSKKFKPPPAGPRSLQPVAPKRPIVIGSAWSAAKSVNALTGLSAEPAPTKKKGKRRVGGDSQPPPDSTQSTAISTDAPAATQPPPPPTLAPPLPPRLTLSVSTASKWKPVSPNERTLDLAASLSEQRKAEETDGVHPNRSRLESVLTKPPSTTNSSPHSSEFHYVSSSSESSIWNMDSKDPDPPFTPIVPKAEEVSHSILPSLRKDTPPHLKKSISRKSTGFPQLGEMFDLTSSSPPPPPLSSTTSKVESVSTFQRFTPASTAGTSNPVGPSASLPLLHPLPPKPTNLPWNRGVKRERPLSPDLGHWSPSTPPRRRLRPSVNFPTIQSSATKVLQGEGEPTMQTIHFSADGSYFVLSCSDRTIRVWSTRERLELARLTHHSPIVNAFWLENDAGVIALTDDGLISKWTKTGENSWVWAKVLNAGNDHRSEQDPICFAYTRDRIAVSFPRMGVKVWIWSKGIWQPQRSILRQNVTAIKFIEDGAALLGGTRDGALWYCETPNGTLRAYAFLKTKIISLDVSPQGTHVLVGAVGGGASLVAIRKAENKGHIEKIYSCKNRDESCEFGAAFATKGQAILFASVDSCVLVWDRKKGSVVYGLEHDEDDCIQTVATVDSIAGREGCMITGTRRGQLCWWALPVAAGQSQEDSKKKQKI